MKAVLTRTLAVEQRHGLDWRHGQAAREEEREIGKKEKK